MAMAQAAGRPRTIIDKIWDAHRVASPGGGLDLLHIDRHVVQETTSAHAFDALKARDVAVLRPDLTIGTQDHLLSTAPGRTEETFAPGRDSLRKLRENCRTHGIRVFDAASEHQGIAHVIAPELGFALPGATLVCGDSHTATVGGLGTLAWGTGTTEVGHVLAAQALRVTRPRTMRITFRGATGFGVTAKDMVLHMIGRLGADAGTGHFVEYAGEGIRGLGIEGRLTVCNMSIEFGARSGIVAPDEATFAYLRGRMFAPSGARWDMALRAWQALGTNDGAAFDTEAEIDSAQIAPQVTWDTSPQHVVPVGGTAPGPEAFPDERRRTAARRALEYMGLRPGTRMEGLPVDMVFIGSCTNGRLSDLESAAQVVRGRHVAPGVRAMVVPGSAGVRRAAEARGLDRVFREAGFEWREAGCSLCVSINDDIVAPGKRCVAMSNRNFEGRQGPGSRTHLCSPAMAAAAVMGSITDVRRLAAA